MLFNPDTSKQTQEIVFFRKKDVNQGSIHFSNMPIVKENVQKYLGLFLDVKLNFLEHINDKIKKANEGISAIKKTQFIITIFLLITIYKSFTRPHLDYGDIIYGQPNNASFSDKIESIQ